MDCAICSSRAGRRTPVKNFISKYISVLKHSEEVLLVRLLVVRFDVAS
jgi:hypothetical protein